MVARTQLVTGCRYLALALGSAAVLLWRYVLHPGWRLVTARRPPAPTREPARPRLGAGAVGSARQARNSAYLEAIAGLQGFDPELAQDAARELGEQYRRNYGEEEQRRLQDDHHLHRPSRPLGP